MESENARGILSHGTYKHYKSCLKSLKAFINTHYNKKDISLNRIDLKFIEEFDTYLVKRNLGRNTINSNYHKKLKTTLSGALKHSLIEKNPYENFKLKQESTIRSYLTEDELVKIQSYNFKSNLSLDKVRDLFVFSCYTGLRFSDAQDLKPTDVQCSDGNYFIYRKQKKTNEIVHIPLNQIAVEILDKYDNDERKIKNKLLPQISNQKLNAYIKMVGELLGIDKILTHHVARHTYATILINNGVNLSAVQKVLGHQSIRTTQVYAKMSNTTISKEVLNVFNKINNGK
jgi:site-specific recombinase XerD